MPRDLTARQRHSDDLIRLSDEYADRERRLADDTRYSHFNSAHLFTLQGRQRAVIRMLRQHGFGLLI